MTELHTNGSADRALSGAHQSDVVSRLRCVYREQDSTGCGLCTFCVARAEIERLRAAERRSHDLWWLACHHGPVTLTVRGSHEMHRTVTVNGRSYNYDNPADVALLEARRG